MFRETFKGDSWELQGYLKEVKRLFKGGFMLCQRCFKEVSRVFKESVKFVLRKCHKQSGLR